MKTTAFLLGPDNEEIQELFELIESHKMQIASPMLIPTLLAGFNLNYVRNRLYHCHEISNAVKHEIGLATSVITPSFRDPLITDSVKLSQNLTTISSKLAKYGQHCDSLLDLSRALDEASRSCFEATLEQRNITVGEALASVRTLISYLAAMAKSSKDWTEFLRRRGEGYVQIVHSSLLNETIYSASS